MPPRRRARLKNVKAKVDDDVLDDMIDVDGDGVADMTAAQLRQQQAKEGKQKLADREADYKKNERDLKEMKANTKAKVDSFKSTDLKRIYEGKMKVASGIGKIQLLDLPSSDATRKAFSEAILGKSPSEMDRLYLKNALSGKGQPPKGLKSAAEVVAYVAKHANAIGYVPADTVLTGVKKVGLE